MLLIHDVGLVFWRNFFGYLPRLFVHFYPFMQNQESFIEKKVILIALIVVLLAVWGAVMNKERILISIHFSSNFW